MKVSQSSILKLVRFLAKQQFLQLRQRLQVSCKKSHAKKRCIGVMPNDRYCKKIIISGVGAPLVYSNGIFPDLVFFSISRSNHLSEELWNTQ